MEYTVAETLCMARAISERITLETAILFSHEIQGDTVIFKANTSGWSLKRFASKKLQDLIETQLRKGIKTDRYVIYLHKDEVQALFGLMRLKGMIK